MLWVVVKLLPITSRFFYLFSSNFCRTIATLLHAAKRGYMYIYMNSLDERKSPVDTSKIPHFSIYYLFRENLVPISQLLSNLALRWALSTIPLSNGICVYRVLCEWSLWFHKDPVLFRSLYRSHNFMCNRMRELVK